MILNNVRLVDHTQPVNIRVSGSNIATVSSSAIPLPLHDLELSFEDALAFPGLINSHDHLDFNLFPQLGNRLYPDYTAWGRYIHQHYHGEIAKVLQVPLVLREQWGVLKNLLCGVTTVVNHGEKVRLQERLINIPEQYHCLHSVQFEKQWKLKLNHPRKHAMRVVIHVGEGTNPAACEEIDQLLRWNFWRKKLIGVHAVAMSNKQAKKFEAIVWCPQSNFFLLKQTARINQLKKHTQILFGTDSTLTSHWNIWEHIRMARETDMLSDKELYDTLHVNPAAIWQMKNGAVQPGYKADLVVTKKRSGQNGLEAFFATRPEDLLLVLQEGHIRLFDAGLLPQLGSIDLLCFSCINIHGVPKYIQGDVPTLIQNIRQYYPEAQFPVTVNAAVKLRV